jgi:hypothetical protein
MLIVGTMDGGLHALSGASGDLLWTFESGGKVVSSSFLANLEADAPKLLSQGRKEQNWHREAVSSATADMREPSLQTQTAQSAWSAPVHGQAEGPSRSLSAELPAADPNAAGWHIEDVAEDESLPHAQRHYSPPTLTAPPPTLQGTKAHRHGAVAPAAPPPPSLPRVSPPPLVAPPTTMHETLLSGQPPPPPPPPPPVPRRPLLPPWLGAKGGAVSSLSTLEEHGAGEARAYGDAEGAEGRSEEEHDEEPGEEDGLLVLPGLDGRLFVIGDEGVAQPLTEHTVQVHCPCPK